MVAYAAQSLARRVVRRLVTSYNLPPKLITGVGRATGFVIYTAALILILEQLGVSGRVLWTAFTGFAAVAAIAFFAAWSVLSNIFCAMLILATRHFRRGDYIELLEGEDKPGLRGRVREVNLVATTIEELDASGKPAGTLLQVPNNLFFQRTVRRFLPGIVPAPRPAAGEPSPTGTATPA